MNLSLTSFPNNLKLKSISLNAFSYANLLNSNSSNNRLLSLTLIHPLGVAKIICLKIFLLDFQIQNCACINFFSQFSHDSEIFEANIFRHFFRLWEIPLRLDPFGYLFRMNDISLQFSFLFLYIMYTLLKGCVYKSFNAIKLQDSIKI